MEKVVYEYIRRPNRQPIGVLCAVLVDGEVQVGWSLCRKGDRFGKELGRRIALGRAMNGSVDVRGTKGQFARQKGFVNLHRKSALRALLNIKWLDETEHYTVPYPETVERLIQGFAERAAKRLLDRSPSLV
jgi:hypothetical protein